MRAALRTLRPARAFLALAGLLAASVLPAAAEYPYANVRPSQLKFPPLKFAPPEPVKKVLPNGMTLYLLQDSELPLFNAQVYIRTGSIYEPADKVGLAELTGMTMRTGGTARQSGDQLDQQLEFLAATVETSIGTEMGTARLSVLKKDVPTGLQALADVLRRPAFAQAKIELAKRQMIDEIQRRNDEPEEVAQRYFAQAIYGADSPWARVPSVAGVQKLTREDVVAFHDKYYAPNNIILAAAGDLTTDEMARQIEAVFGDWERKPVELPAVPKVTDNFTPGVEIVAKDVNQANIRMGHLGIQRHNPDRFAIRVMGYILGEGGFASHLMQEVRTNQGLAYSVWGGIGENQDRGLFEMGAETKTATTRAAIDSMRKVMQQMITTPVSAQELAAAKESILNAFVFRFQSRFQIASQRAMLDYLGFPPDYLSTFPSKIRAVTVADVQRVARQYMHPDRMVTLVVGPPAEMEKQLAGLGPIRTVTPEEPK